MKKVAAILSTLLIAGFVFRYVGIQKNLSFWNDENHTALMARGILWYGKPVTPIGVGAGVYQIAFYYLTAVAFKFAGVNETVGRFPSVVAGTILIAVVYFLTTGLFGGKQALIAALLTTFSQIQLAWSTQLRPYIWLEIFSLLVLYFSYRYQINIKKYFDKNLIIASSLALVASLFHGVGLVNFSFIGTALLIKIYRQKEFKYLFLLFFFVLIALGLAYFSGPDFFNYHISHFSFRTLHYRIFFTHNYYWLISPGIIGSYFLYKKNRDLFVFFPLAAVFIIVFSDLKINPDYVRYSLPAFPILYMLFAQAVVKLKYIGIILGVVCLILAIRQNKILLTPRYYYSINADVRENPIVDYKLAFNKVKTLIKNRKDVIVIDAWNDRVPYYLPNQKFMMIYKNRGNTEYDPFYGEKYVKNIPEFESEKSKYSAGIVIVENWENFETEEVKNHVHTNLKHEFDVNNLRYNEEDKWSISVYSWGL